MAKMTGELTIFVISLVILAGRGQVIRNPLQPVIAPIGANVSFTCDTDATGMPGSETAIEWLRDIGAPQGEESIALFLNGGFMKNVSEKYSVDVPNKLVIKNVQLSDGGRYMCKVYKSEEKKSTNLIVIEPPTSGSQAPQYNPGDQAEFHCQVRFGAPGKDSIPAEQMPSMKGFVNGKFSEGEEPMVTEGVPGANYWQIRQEYLYQIANDSTVEYYDFKCEVHTENPRTIVITNASAALAVAVHDIVIEPLKDEYEVGEVIKCSAQGHPAPKMAWRPKLSPSPHTVSGGDLEITVPMVGENQWTCKATNEILSIHYEEETTISFNVPKPTTTTKAPYTASSNTTTIIIAVVVVAVILLLAIIIGVVIYKRRQSRSGYAAGKETRKTESARNGDYSESAQTDPEHARIEDDQNVSYNKPKAAPRNKANDDIA